MKLLSQICDELGGKENENDDLDRRCPFYARTLIFSKYSLRHCPQMMVGLENDHSQI
jgi:hypothetical protein